MRLSQKVFQILLCLEPARWYDLILFNSVVLEGPGPRGWGPWPGDDPGWWLAVRAPPLLLWQPSGAGSPLGPAERPAVRGTGAPGGAKEADGESSTRAREGFQTLPRRRVGGTDWPRRRLPWACGLARSQGREALGAGAPSEGPGSGTLSAHRSLADAALGSVPPRGDGGSPSAPEALPGEGGRSGAKRFRATRSRMASRSCRKGGAEKLRGTAAGAGVSSSSEPSPSSTREAPGGQLTTAGSESDGPGMYEPPPRPGCTSATSSDP